MSWIISLRRADAIKQADLILAQCDGVLGPWRVVEVRIVEGVMTHARPPGVEARNFGVEVRLVAQGDTSQMPLMQLLGERQLVPVLVPLPEPEPSEAVATLRLKVELA